MFEDFCKTRTKRINDFLECFLLSKANHSQLYQAIQYSVLNGGKRIRPLLVYATGEALGASLEHLDAAAGAIELIHTYSLIHDDLPAMDNDDLRRGKPTCHKAFNEAIAILAGDALQTFAFELLSDSKLNPLDPKTQIDMIRTLTEASGANGMVLGQALDLEAESASSDLNLEALSFIHHHKTGALIEAAIILGLLASGCKEIEIFSQLEEYARSIGLAFQIQDDILDIIGEATLLGKNPGMDAERQKATFPRLLGLEGAKEYASKLQEQASLALQCLGNRKDNLDNLSNLFIHRIN